MTSSIAMSPRNPRPFTASKTTWKRIITTYNIPLMDKLNTEMMENVYDRWIEEMCNNSFNFKNGLSVERS